MFSLKNKTAVVTGGGSGIGQAIAVLFARQGAIVHILELSEEAGFETKNRIDTEGASNVGFRMSDVGRTPKSDIPNPKYTEGGTCTVHTCNVVDQKAVLATFKAIGKVDILVNNAGIAHIGNADFDRVFNVNVKGVYNCLHVVIPMMKANGGGVILNMSSISAYLGLSDRFAYSMSKAAVYNMTMTVAKDFIKDNIRCNSMSPARVHTPFVDGFLEKNYPTNKAEMFEKLSKSQPIGRMGKPEEVAALALFLCSDEAGFITGSDYPIDGGFTKLNT
jgi:2-keto-3-deoxy-L-fuconate dehydrogenase